MQCKLNWRAWQTFLQGKKGRIGIFEGAIGKGEQTFLSGHPASAQAPADGKQIIVSVNEILPSI